MSAAFSNINLWWKFALVQLWNNFSKTNVYLLTKAIQKTATNRAYEIVEPLLYSPHDRIALNSKGLEKNPTFPNICLSVYVITGFSSLVGKYPIRSAQ